MAQEERKESLPQEESAEDKILHERLESPEVTEGLTEVEPVLQRVERDHATKGPISDDTTGQTVLTPTGTVAPVIQVPLTEEEIKKGLHHKVIDSVYWLAKFAQRLIKKAALLGLRVIYPQKGQASS